MMELEQISWRGWCWESGFSGKVEIQLAIEPSKYSSDFLFNFSTLFILPSFVYLGCLFYEYLNFDDWMIQWNRSMCKKFSIPCPQMPPNSSREEKPIFSIFMLKYVCSMLVGITSSVWLCSGKTVASWKVFIERLKGRDSRERNYV